LLESPCVGPFQMCDFRVFVPACVFGIRQGGLPA
jgi:hypothetical protein